MTNEVNNVEDTVMFELPAQVKVTGARGLEGTLDLTKASNASLLAVLDYWAGVVTIRASAGVDGFDEKVKAEAAMMERLAKFDWTPGSGGGGGKSVTIETQAERAVLFNLFIAQGAKKGDATKRSKKADAWSDLVRLSLSRAFNRSDISEAEIVEELASQQEVINTMVADQVLAIEAEKARNDALKGNVLFGGSK